MILANIGWDLQAISKGRFLLGLGTQIKPHIEKRFDMPWSKPATRMREMVLAIKSIWNAWENDERLDFRGEIYSNTLMTPMFNPGPAPLRTPADLPGRRRSAHDRGLRGGCGRLLRPSLRDPNRSFAELTLPALDRGLVARRTGAPTRSPSRSR